MKKELSIWSVLCWGMLGMTTVCASPLSTGNGINALQVEQERMIQRGFRDGNLTVSERHMLVSQQNRIKQMEESYRKDGLQGWERKQLLTLLKWSEKSILHKLGNGERRQQDTAYLPADSSY